MEKLSEDLAEQVPERVFAFFREHPELYFIRWTQGYSTEEPGPLFHVNLEELGLDGPGCPAMESSPDEHEIALREEIETFLRSIPAATMVALFGHSHRVWYGFQSFECGLLE